MILDALKLEGKRASVTGSSAGYLSISVAELSAHLPGASAMRRVYSS